MPERRVSAAEPTDAQCSTTGVHACNFRLAGRLSNENARSLMSLHEVFAARAARALDLYLSTAIEVKLHTINQLSIEEYLQSPPSFSVPISLGAQAGNPLLGIHSNLATPLIDILMGGDGTSHAETEELSDIDKEVLSEIVDLLIAGLEETWCIPGVSMTANGSTKGDGFQQGCSPKERLTVLYFSVKLSNTTGSFDVLLPGTVLATLLKRLKCEQPQKKKVWQFPRVPIQERLLDCTFEVRAELPELKVAVHDLIALQPGSVLKLRAPIQTPGKLTAGGRSIFEAVPVRDGSQRAAQLGKRIAQFDGQ